MEDMYPHGGNIEELKEKYCPQKQNVLDFSASINPLGLPKKINSLMKDNLSELSNYPEIYSQRLKNRISGYSGVSKDNLIITNGSIEAVYLVARLLKAKKTLFVIPTFSEYERAVKSNAGKCLYLKAPDKKDFSLDIGQIVNGLPRIDALFICNPNNPTGKVLFADDLLYLAKKCKRRNVFLIIDEAFIDFLQIPAQASLVKHCPRWDNIIVISSFTKFFALAGLRAGYITANKKLIKKISVFCFPWAVNYLAQVAACGIISDPVYINKSRRFILKEKDFLFRQLDKIDALTPYYPAVNFILCRISLGFINSQRLFRMLARKGIFIRDCSNFRGLNDRYFRVAVRKRKDNIKLITALNQVMDSQ